MTHLVVNKMDILSEVNSWNFWDDGKVISLDNRTEFENHLINFLKSDTNTHLTKHYFSDCPETV